MHIYICILGALGHMAVLLISRFAKAHVDVVLSSGKPSSSRLPHDFVWAFSTRTCDQGGVGSRKA